MTHAILPKDEQVELARKAQQGDRRAKERLVNHLQRYVRSIAAKHQGWGLGGLELEDLVSEGNIGLLKGIEKFDPDSGNAITTYCTFWINHQIKRAISDTGSMIRKPNRLVDKAGLMWGVIGRLQTAIGHEPDNEEIAHALNVQGRTYNDGHKTPFTPEHIAHLKDVFRYITSTDLPIASHGRYGDNKVTLLDFVQSDDDTEGEVLEEMNASRVRKLVEGLPDRERVILARRYGIYGEPAKLRVIAAEQGVTLERARQVVVRAEDILRMRCGVTPNRYRVVAS